MNEIEQLRHDLAILRRDYEAHLVFGKWGSTIAIVVFLLIFAVQSGAIVWLMFD